MGMDCLFCQVAAGARAADVVYETRTTIAFLDRDPAARGHTLLVPRRHVPTLLHLPEGAAGSGGFTGQPTAGTLRTSTRASPLGSATI
jgi:histidine triad (HIT) family protein